MLIPTKKERMTRRGFLRLPLLFGLGVSDKKGFPVISRDRCILSKTPCRCCIDSCPFGALTCRGGEISVYENQCERCGFCATACPVDALQMPQFTNPQALDRIEAVTEAVARKNRKGSLVFTCERSRQVAADLAEVSGFVPPALVVHTPCIASLSMAALLRSVEIGLDAVILLCPDQGCGKKEAVRAWGALWHAAEQVIRELSIPARMIAVGWDVGEGAGNPASGPGSGKPPISSGAREDLVRILDALPGLHSPGPCVENLPLPFFDVSIDRSRCIFCGACERQCPTKALEVETGEESCLRFSAFHCIGCGACAENCPENAISVQRYLDLSSLRDRRKVVKLREGSARCRNCGRVIGKKSLLEKVQTDLRRSGFGSVADNLFYCSQCRVHSGCRDEKDTGTGQ